MTERRSFAAIPLLNRNVVALLLAAFVALSGCAEKLSPDAHVEQAEKLHNDGELGSAVIEFKNALQQDPDHAQARWGLALVYLDMGNGPAAEKELRRAAELGVSDDAVLVPMTRALMLQGKLDEVKAQQPNLTALRETEQAQYYTLLGDVHLLSDDPDEAERAYDAALSLADSPEARVGKARAAGVKGDLNVGELQDILEAVLEEAPDFGLAWTQLGDLQHIQGHHEEADEAFTKAIALRYNNSYEYYRRALVRIGMGNYDAAREDAEFLKQRNANAPQVSYLLGLIAFKNGDFAAAQAQFEKAINVDPQFMNAVFYLGAAHFYQGHTLQAEQNLARYHRKFPGSSSTVKLLASTLYQMGSYNKALKVAQPMLRAVPNDPFLLSLMGNIYMKQGNVDEALASLQKLREQSPDSASLRTQIGLGLMATGNYSEGTGELQHAIDLAPDDHEAEMALVMVYLRSRETEKAVEVAQNLSAGNPENPSLMNMLGVTYLANEQGDEARSTFVQALEIDPGNASAAHNLANMALKEGGVDQARGYYEQVLQRQPGHQRTLLKLAQLEVTAGNYDQSLEWLRVAIEKNPEELSPRLHLSRVHLTEEQPDKARALLTPSILNRYKEQPALLILLADIELATGDTGEAIAILEDLVRLLPDSAEARYQLSRAYAVSGNTVKSEAALKESLARDPNHTRSRIAQMRKLVANGEPEQAKRILDVMAAKFPGDPEVLAQQAWFAGQAGTAAEAVSAYEKAYAATPIRELAVGLASSHLKNNDPQRGIAVLEDWVGDHPEDTIVWTNLGNIYLVMGEEDKALSAYQSVDEFDPKNAMVLNNLAWILREKEPKAALGYAERALEIDPKSPSAQDTMGVILLKAGRTRRALDLFKESAAADPGNLDTRYHLGMALVESGDVDGAQKVLKELLSEEQPFSERKNAAALLKSLGG